jgi:uncharacterized protein
MTADTSPKAVVRRYLDVLVRGDVDAIRDSFAENATWTMHGDLPLAGPWRGRDRIVEDFLIGLGGSLFQAGSHRFDFPTLIAEGDTVALEWRVTARSAAGVEYDNEYCGMFVVREGRIVAVREYLDSRYAARVLFPDLD